MPRAARRIEHAPPGPENVLNVLRAIERHPEGSPAAKAFRNTLRRQGIEADAVGGLRALDELRHAVGEAEPERAEDRDAAIREAWAGLLPGKVGISHYGKNGEAA